MFTIFLQTNFYPKKKMASWLSGFVDASCKTLWQTFSRGLLKHFSLDIFVEYDKVALTILCGFSHVSALTFPFFRDQRCGSGTCCHVSTLQMSSYGILSILFPRWGPCGETKKTKKQVSDVYVNFSTKKSELKFFFPCQKTFPNQNQLVLDHLCFPPLEIVCFCVLLSSTWSEEISPSLRMGHETNLIQASR